MSNEDLTVSPRRGRVLRRCVAGKVRRDSPDGFDQDLESWRDVTADVRWLEAAGLVAPHEPHAYPKLVFPTEAGRRWLADNPRGPEASS